MAPWQLEADIHARASAVVSRCDEYYAYLASKARHRTSALILGAAFGSSGIVSLLLRAPFTESSRRATGLDGQRLGSGRMCRPSALSLSAHVDVAAFVRGPTALHVAAASGRADIVKMLLLADADVMALDGTGLLPIEVASNAEVRQLLKTEDARFGRFKALPRMVCMLLKAVGTRMDIEAAKCDRPASAATALTDILALLLDEYRACDLGTSTESPMLDESRLGASRAGSLPEEAVGLGGNRDVDDGEDLVLAVLDALAGLTQQHPANTLRLTAGCIAAVLSCLDDAYAAMLLALGLGLESALPQDQALEGPHPSHAASAGPEPRESGLSDSVRSGVTGAAAPSPAAVRVDAADHCSGNDGRDLIWFEPFY